MADAPASPVDLVLDVESLLLESLDLVERLADDIRADAVVPWSFTGHLCQLRATTVEVDWELDVWDVRHWLAGYRGGGPFTTNGRTWSCAAQCLTEIVGRIEETLWRYEPFGDAVARFNDTYRRYRHELNADDQDPDDILPSEGAVLSQIASGDYMVQRPSELIVLRSVWPEAGDPTTIEAVVPDEVLVAARHIRTVWEKGTRPADVLIRAQREQLATMPLDRLRGEIEWECSRAVAEWDLRQPDRSHDRVPRRFRTPDPVARDERITARDAWIYEQVIAGALTYDAIMRRLKKEAPIHGWRILGSAEAVRQRAIRHAELNHLELPKPRQSR